MELDTADSSTIGAFFKWVSASIATSSKRIDAGGGDVKGLAELPPPPAEINAVI